MPRKRGKGWHHGRKSEYAMERLDGDTWDGRFLSELLGDYFFVQDDLLDIPKPYDPQRMTAVPLGGYGWPEDEATIRICVGILSNTQPWRPSFVLCYRCKVRVKTTGKHCPSLVHPRKVARLECGHSISYDPDEKRYWMVYGIP